MQSRSKKMQHAPDFPKDSSTYRQIVKQVLKSQIQHLVRKARAYPGSEFVVANSLAKRKKLEPNENDFSHEFSQKVVSRSFSAFNSLPASGNFWHLLITYAKSLDPDQARHNGSGSKLFDTQNPVSKYGTIIKCD